MTIDDKDSTQLSQQPVEDSDNDSDTSDAESIGSIHSAYMAETDNEPQAVVSMGRNTNGDMSSEETSVITDSIIPTGSAEAYRRTLIHKEKRHIPVIPVMRIAHEHMQHGSLIIEVVQSKDKNKKQVDFKIALGNNLPHTVSMVFDRHDNKRHFQMTIGYGNIDFPDYMKGKGIAHVLHLAAATAVMEAVSNTTEQGKILFTVDAVTTAQMKAVCSKAEMHDVNGDFELPITQLLENERKVVAQKGWNTPKITLAPLQ
ncbi:MAG: hypothetical protein ACXWIN_03995 [Burkholderiaceae bacterium]